MIIAGRPHKALRQRLVFEAPFVVQGEEGKIAAFDNGEGPHEVLYAKVLFAVLLAGDGVVHEFAPTVKITPPRAGACRLSFAKGKT